MPWRFLSLSLLYAVKLSPILLQITCLLTKVYANSKSPRSVCTKSCFVYSDADGVGSTDSTWEALSDGHSFVHIGVPI